MHDIRLGEVRVRLGEPRQVTEGVDYHWFPSLAKFPTGELMLSHLLVADTNENHLNGNGVCISRDHGETWAAPYEVTGFIGGCAVRVPLPDGGLGAPGYYAYPDPTGRSSALVGHYETFSEGGRRYSLEPWAVRIEGLPRPVAPSPYTGRWGRHWMFQFCFWGDAVDLGGEVVSLAYLRYDGDKHYSEVALRSADQGRTWTYLAPVASRDDIPGATEGPNETSLVRLADGDILAVMRVGSGSGQPLVKTYSSDGGRTWSRPERLPAFSVAPCVRRLQNGVLALSTGRPGIYLWLSADPRGDHWESFDILGYHNEVMGPAHQMRPGQGGHHATDPYQTTAYTVMAETTPNRLLLTYDRIPFGWNPVPLDSDERNRIYTVTIDVERE